MRLSMSTSLAFLKNVYQFIIISFVMMTFSSLSYAGNPIELTLGYQINESFPYQMGYGSQIANPPGIAVDILKAAAEKVGVDIKIVRYPNKRVQLYLSKGEIDGAFMYSFQEKRMVNGRYPRKDGKVDSDRRITNVSYSLYTLKGGSLRWDGKKISGLTGRIGAGRGYSIVGDLQKMGVKVDEVNSERKAFAILILNRIAAVAAQGTTADPLIKEKGYSTIEKLEPPLKSKPYFLMLNHQFVGNHPDVAERLWNAIGQVREQVVQDVSGKYLK